MDCGDAGHIHQLYLKGRFFWNKRTGDNLEKALKYFNQAVEQDPGYAPPYAGIADVYMLLPLYTDAAPADTYPKGKAAAKKALQLDETLGGSARIPRDGSGILRSRYAAVDPRV